MVKKRKYSHRYVVFGHGNLTGVILTVALMFVRYSHSARKSVPDTSGTHFWFSTPLCSPTYPASVLVIPQTTNAVNVTLVSLDTGVSMATDVHTIWNHEALTLTLPCPTFTWGHVQSSKGFELVSTSEVNVHIEYKDDSQAAFPLDVLRTKYVISSMTSSDFTDTFIVIHGNNTTVELTFPENMQTTVAIENVNYIGGSRTNISLHFYGVVGIYCACDLTGATITSDLPISVYTGAKKYSSIDGFIEQVPPFTTWGRKFIFLSHSWADDNITLSLTGTDPSTSIAINSEIYSFSPGSNTTEPMTLVLNITVKEFLSVSANSSVLCSVLYHIRDTLSGKHAAFRYLTPLLLYHVHYYFQMENAGNDELSVNLILKQSSFQFVTFNRTENNPFEQAMTYYWNYFVAQNVILSSPSVLRVSDANYIPFHGTIFRRNNQSAYEYSLGMRIVDIYNACFEQHRAYGGNGDGIDNDCDNLIDEEILNKKDDDNDGLIDEDIRYSGHISPHETVWEYHMRNKEKEETGLSISLISIVISISVALTSVICFIGGMLLAEKIRRSSSRTRVTPIC